MRLLSWLLQLLLTAALAVGGACEVALVVCILSTPSLWDWTSPLMLAALALHLWFLPRLIRALRRI